MIEHEALAMLLAQQAGVPVPHVVTVGRTIEGDAVLVTERAGTPLSALDADVIDDDHPAAAWHALLNLHAAGLAHGRIDRDRLLALGDCTAPGKDSVTLTDRPGRGRPRLLRAAVAGPEILLADRTDASPRNDRLRPVCRWTLARAHGRSGDRIAAAYLGGSAKFDQAIAEFAETYADQNERDYAGLQTAVKDGKAEVVTAGI